MKTTFERDENAPSSVPASARVLVALGELGPMLAVFDDGSNHNLNLGGVATSNLGPGT